MNGYLPDKTYFEVFFMKVKPLQELGEIEQLDGDEKIHNI
jgi:hypothetical protein